MALIKHNDKMVILDNAMFAYAKLAEPTLKYQSVSDKEYSIDIIIDKATAKAWNKEFPKQKAKELDAEEFKAKFKLDAPFDSEEVFVVKGKKAASKDGVEYDPKFRPRAIVRTEAGDVDITVSKLISNGSTGKVSFRINENSFGKFAQLNTVFMEEDGFIEYVSAGGGSVASEFGAKIVNTEPENKAATQARATKAKKAEVLEQDEDDSSLPF